MKMTHTAVVRLLLFAVATAFIVYFLPRTNERHYSYEINRPWVYSLLTAPFDIPVHLDSIRAAAVKDSIDASFIPVYMRDVKAADNIVKALNERLGSSDKAVASTWAQTSLEQRVRQLLDDGIVDQSVYAQIVSGKLPYVRIITNNVAHIVPTSSFRSPRVAYAWLDSMLPAHTYHVAIDKSGLHSLLTANVLPDTAASNRMLAEMYQKAMAPIGVIQQGERIVDRGDIVTPQLYTILKTYEAIQAERGADSKTDGLYPFIGQVLYVVLLLSSLYCYLYFFRRRLFDDNKVILMLLLLNAGFTVFTFLMSKAFVSGLYIVPFTMVPIMVLVFFDGRTALFCHLLQILLCAAIASFTLEFIFIQFIAGVTAINLLKELSRRSQLLRTALMVFLAYSVSYIAVEMMQTHTITTISTRMFGCFAINAVFISFAYVLIFVFEKLFGFTSVVSLVELSDINNPTLRLLSEECPGTFQHSMSVSNLAADAANAIDADVQLVRAGALYHDIGKINNPTFFTENQHGVNPHDALDPIQSARVVIGHVTDGLKRAEKAKLPKVLRAFITEHHGRGTARYFYNTYCNAHPDEDVDSAPFTYPGPNPKSRETSLLMMADSVEAASRSLSEYSQEAITALVDRIIDTQIAEGLHNDSPLSFNDVQIIKRSFVNRLRTIYHSRIAYPDDPHRQ
jgi:hypothetical protein